MKLCPGCTDNSGTSNYFHLTISEHICYNCYEEMVRTGRSTNNAFIQWKNLWLQESRCAPSLRLFAMDTLLPFWLQCSDCKKFRKTRADVIEWSPDELAGFTCNKVEGILDGKVKKNGKLYKNACEVEEDEVSYT